MVGETTWTKTGLFAELEALGEGEVREQLAAGLYGFPGQQGVKRPLVEVWLRWQEEARKEASQSQQIEEALRAADAAARANTRATIALIIAAVSAVTAIASTIISVLK
jgi:hypothetical protein